MAEAVNSPMENSNDMETMVQGVVTPTESKQSSPHSAEDNIMVSFNATNELAESPMAASSSMASITKDARVNSTGNTLSPDSNSFAFQNRMTDNIRYTDSPPISAAQGVDTTNFDRLEALWVQNQQGIMDALIGCSLETGQRLLQEFTALDELITSKTRNLNMASVKGRILGLHMQASHGAQAHKDALTQKGPTYLMGPGIAAAVANLSRDTSEPIVITPSQRRSEAQSFAKGAWELMESTLGSSKAEQPPKNDLELL